MNNNILTGPELPPINNEKPKQLCIILHGYGADGYDLAALCKPIADHFPSMQFLVPNAPTLCEINPDGYQWFSLLDRSPTTMYSQALTAENILNEYINQQLTRFNLTDNDLILMGFSQGTMLALHTMLRREKACRMVIGFSGMMLGTIEQIKDNLKSKPTICLVHGKDDHVVSFQAFEEACHKLKSCNFNFSSKSIPHLGHSIDYEGLNFAINELQKTLV